METSSRDVLPADVRRRLSRRDGLLPVVLMGELLAGMALGVVWPSLTAATAPAYPQTTTIAVTTRPLVPQVPLAPPPPTAVPVVLHAPRNPFGTPEGIDASLQQAPPVPAPHAVAPPLVSYAPPTVVYAPPPAADRPPAADAPPPRPAADLFGPPAEEPPTY